MVKYLVLITAILISVQLYAQEFKIIPDEKTGEPLILGYCPVSEMNDSVFSGAWTDEYDSYTPDNQVLDSLKGKLDNVDITIVFRSTCGDSREQVPRFFKILDELNYPLDKLTLIGVDRAKKDLSGDVDKLDIGLVPTFIFYKDGKELGRIIETPNESLEKDLLRIIE